MLRITLLTLCFGLVSIVAWAAPGLCPEHFAGGRLPVLVNARLTALTQPLCFQAFAVLHSGVTRTPLYSAEHLTREGLRSARETPRQGEFHAEPQVPADQRAELSDYARSGYDRGHLAPSGDMPDAEAQQESFSLANMVPQDSKLNRGLWEGIESAVRSYATRRGTLFVVTGPAFVGGQLASTGGVIVPTAVWKAVLDPARGTAAAYVAQNDDGGAWQVMSMAQLASLTGIEVFPGLSPQSRSRAMRLPNPTPHRGRSANPRAGGLF